MTILVDNPFPLDINALISDAIKHGVPSPLEVKADGGSFVIFRQQYICRNGINGLKHDDDGYNEHIQYPSGHIVRWHRPNDSKYEIKNKVTIGSKGSSVSVVYTNLM